MTPDIRNPFTQIRAHLRVFVILNIVLFGSLLAGMGVGLVFPEITASRVAELEGSATADLVSDLVETPMLFALVILANNLVRASLISIVLPSMIVPFSGIAIFVVQAFLTGLILAPTGSGAMAVLIPHSLTIVIEFEAYALLMFGVYLLGRSWLFPHTVEAETRRRGYLQGLRRLGWLSIPAVVLLVIGAVYEALSVRFLLPLLAG